MASLINTNVNSLSGWALNGLHYTRACLNGLYQRVTRKPVQPLTAQVTEYFRLAAAPAITVRDKIITFEEVDFSDRSYYLFPKVKRAHIIADRDLIKAGLQIPRDGDHLHSGLHAGFDTLVGTHNMLLHRDHARLRKPLEQFFSTRSAQSPALMKEINISALASLSQMRKEKKPLSSAIQNFIHIALIETLLGIPVSADLKNLLEVLNKIDATPQNESHEALSRCIKAIFARGGLKPGRIFDILQKDTTLSEEEIVSTAIVLLFAATHTSIGFLNFFMELINSHPDLLSQMHQEWRENYSLSNKETSISISEFVKNSKWLEASFLETARLYPILPDVSRIAKQNLQIGDLHVAAGDELHFNLMASQRRGDEWGKDATEFHPERFLDDQERRVKLVTFGSGRQQCLGKFIAKNEIKTFAAMFVILMGAMKGPEAPPPKPVQSEVAIVGPAKADQLLYSLQVKRT